AEDGGDGAGDFGRFGESRDEDGAGVEGVDRMAAQTHETGFCFGGVQRGAAAARAMGDDGVGDLGGNSDAGKGIDNEGALEGAVGCGREVLELAAAAGPEMRAGRGAAVGARRDYVEEAGAVALDLGNDRFAGEGERDEDRLAVAHGDALAAKAEALDGEGFGAAHLLARRDWTAPSSGIEGCAPRVRQASPAATPARSMA